MQFLSYSSQRVRECAITERLKLENVAPGDKFQGCPVITGGSALPLQLPCTVGYIVHYSQLVIILSCVYLSLHYTVHYSLLVYYSILEHYSVPVHYSVLVYFSVQQMLVTYGVTFLEGCLAPWPVVTLPSSKSHYLNKVTVQVYSVTWTASSHTN